MSEENSNNSSPRNVVLTGDEFLGMQERISLAEFAKEIGHREQILKEFIAEQIIKIFSIANSAILLLVGAIVLIEFVFLWFSPNTIADSGRLIDNNVIIALIAATVAQTGAAAAAIVISLFPAKRDA